MSNPKNNNNNLPPPPLPHPPPPHSNFSLLSVLSREKLTRPNYLDWMCSLRITLRYEGKEYVLDEDLLELNDESNDEDVASYSKHYDKSTKVDFLVLEIIHFELRFESLGAFDINE